MNLLSGLQKLIFPPQCLLCRNKSLEKLCQKCWPENQGITKVAGNCFSLWEYDVPHHNRLAKYSKSDDSLLRLPNIKSDIQESFRQAFPNPTILHAVPTTKDGHHHTKALVDILLEIPSTQALSPTALHKTKHAEKQALLTKAARLENVAKAFWCEPLPDNLKSKHHIIVDDITTTGATFNACQKALEKAGAKKISTFSLWYGL